MKSKVVFQNKGQVSSESDIVFDSKIRLVSEGLALFYEKMLSERTSKENSLIIVNYVLRLKTEINPSLNYRKMNITVLVYLCDFLCQKNIKQMKREDIISFLDSLRKSETSDPLHKWIGTYNLYRVLLSRFFRWFYSPDVEQNKRLKPSVIGNIPPLKRKEQSIYKPTDLWTVEDDLLFLKYCSSPRDRCYHAISRDLSCRPHEILNLRLKEVVFKTVGKYQYAEVLVNGKTGTRPIPLISSIPFLKDWIDQHPQRGNPNAFLIPTLSDRSYGRKMSSHTANVIYRKYKLQHFPRLLDDPSVMPEDKRKITELLKKPFNPYLRRHVGLTEKSKILKENILKQYAGWSGNSQMHLKYLHYFGNESSESILEAFGIVTKEQQPQDQLKPKQCPNCSEPNKPDSRFCAKCRMVLVYDEYLETLERQKQKENEVEEMKKRMNIIEEGEKELLELLKHPKELLGILMLYIVFVPMPT